MWYASKIVPYALVSSSNVNSLYYVKLSCIILIYKHVYCKCSVVLHVDLCLSYHVNMFVISSLCGVQSIAKGWLKSDITNIDCSRDTHPDPELGLIMVEDDPRRRRMRQSRIRVDQGSQEG